MYLYANKYLNLHMITCLSIYKYTCLSHISSHTLLLLFTLKIFRTVNILANIPHLVVKHIMDVTKSLLTSQINYLFHITEYWLTILTYCNYHNMIKFCTTLSSLSKLEALNSKHYYRNTIIGI